MPTEAKSEAKFTKGPWHLHDCERYTVCGPDHLAISLSDAKSRSDAENDANARLQSAAPELLEALEDMILRRGEGWERVVKAKKAIAKARGE